VSRGHKRNTRFSSHRHRYIKQLQTQAFPSSAAHGLEWWQLDVSYGFIRLLERCGLAWDVRRPTEAQKARLRA
jgi:hypothetical protein